MKTVTIISLLLISTLSSCGGGGGGSTIVTPQGTTLQDSVGYAVDDYVLGGAVKIYELSSGKLVYETSTVASGYFGVPKELVGGFRIEISEGVQDIDGDPNTLTDQKPFVEQLAALVTLNGFGNSFALSAITTGIANYAGTNLSKYDAAFANLPAELVAMHRSNDPKSLQLPNLQKLISLHQAVGFNALVSEYSDDGTINNSSSAGVSSETVLRAIAAIQTTEGFGGISDANLRLCVADKLQKQPTTVNLADMLTIDRLHCDGYGINNLQGIGLLSALKALHLDDNQVADIAPLASLNNLELVSIINNRVSTISHLRTIGRKPVIMFISENCLTGSGELLDDGIVITKYDRRFRKQYANCLKNDVELGVFEFRGARTAGGARQLLYRTTYSQLASCSIKWGDGSRETVNCDGQGHYLTHTFNFPTQETAEFIVNDVQRKLIRALITTEPVINVFDPVIAKVGINTTFKVTGTNLPATNHLDITFNGCANIQFVSQSAAQHQFTCTPNTAGTLTAVIRALPSTTPLGSFPVVVSTGPLLCTAPQVQSNGACVTPTNVSVDIPATNFINGLNVALSANGYGVDTLMNAPPYGAAPNGAQWLITVPAGRYKLFATYASGVSRPVAISINGTTVFANALASATGGFFPANRQTFLQGTVELPTNVSIMTVSRGDSFPHIQGFTLVPEPLIGGVFHVESTAPLGTVFVPPTGATTCTFNATGQWNNNGVTSNANGDSTFSPTVSLYLQSANFFSLIAKSTEAGYQFVGTSQMIPVAPGQTFSFMPNEGVSSGDVYYDNSGSMTVSYVCSG